MTDSIDDVMDKTGSIYNKKRRVAKRACLACREKKIKCDGEMHPGPDGGPGRCTNCANTGGTCVFVASNRGGRRVFGKMKHQQQRQNSPTSTSSYSRRDSGHNSSVSSNASFTAPNTFVSSSAPKLVNSSTLNASGENPASSASNTATTNNNNNNNNNSNNNNNTSPSASIQSMPTPTSHILPLPPLEKNGQFIIERRALGANSAINSKDDSGNQNEYYKNPLNNYGIPKQVQYHGISMPGFMVPVNNAENNNMYQNAVPGQKLYDGVHIHTIYNQYPPMTSFLPIQHAGNVNNVSSVGVMQNRNYGPNPNMSTIPLVNPTVNLQNGQHNSASPIQMGNWVSPVGPRNRGNSISIPSPNTQGDLKDDNAVTDSHTKKISQKTNAVPKDHVITEKSDGSSNELSPVANIVQEPSTVTHPSLIKVASPLSDRQSEKYCSASNPSQEEQQFHVINDSMIHARHFPNFPSVSTALVLVDLFYDYVHSKINILQPKEEQIYVVISRMDISLTYAIFLCAMPYIHMQKKNDKRKLESFPTPKECLRIISENWDDLDYLQSLQTLNILVYYFTCIKIDKISVTAYLDKLIKTIAYSNVVSEYRTCSDLAELFEISTIKTLVQSRLLLMNLWVGFSQLCHVRFFFMDHNLLHDSLNLLCSTDERLENRILPFGLLIFFWYRKNKQQDFPDEIPALAKSSEDTKKLFLLHLKDLEDNFTPDAMSSSLYHFYLCKIFHDWRNKKPSNFTALNKVDTLETSVQGKLFELKNDKTVMLINWDVLNTLSISESVKLTLRDTPPTLEILHFDVFAPEIKFIEISELDAAVAKKIPLFEAFYVMQCFQSLLQVLDIVALIEIALGKLPVCTSGVQQVRYVTMSLFEKYSNDNKQGNVLGDDNAGVQTDKLDDDTSRSLQECDLDFNERKVQLWMKYPTVFNGLVRFALPKLLNYIVFFKFMKFVPFDNKCALVYANKSLLLDEGQFNLKNLLARAKDTMYFGGANLSDSELLSKLVSTLELAYLKEKLNVLIEFTKNVSSVMDSKEQIHKNLQDLEQYISDILGFAF
ncbi:hypothetical protein C6P41_003125 [Kluyveromyces marxianus]|nr:hypothetical protein C6P43_002367 [Kluyveromyces marxianus]KAG0685836.1 hypothetical protein C6P41_003125 [Kluyveromyces marxianus]